MAVDNDTIQDELGALVEGALEEIRQQILTRGDNKVWIDDWRERYGALGGTPREFMERRPDMFCMHYAGKGNRYTVSLTGKGKGNGVAKGAPKGSSVPGAVWQLGAPKGAAPMAIAGQPWQARGKGKGKHNMHHDDPTTDTTLDALIAGEQGTFETQDRPDGWLGRTMGDVEREAVEELSWLVSQSANGKVWIELWKERYGVLARSPRDFMEMRCDVFNVTRTGDRSYSVTLVGEGQGINLHDAALKEIKMSIDSQGQVWIQNWKERYGELAPTPRAFMESLPDMFQVLPGVGGRYTVTLLGEADVAPGDNNDGKADDKAADAPKEPVFEEYAEAEAIEEICNQLTGDVPAKVWINNWRERYGSLASSPREFMQARPDIFVLHFQGKSYTVSLAGAPTKRPDDSSDLDAIAENLEAAAALKRAETVEGNATTVPPWKRSRNEAPGGEVTTEAQDGSAPA